MPSLQWLCNALCASPKIHWGQALRGPIISYMRQTRRNQSRFWQWHAANSCKFSTLQENHKKKRLGGWACPTKGLEKNRNLSLSFEGLTLLKGSGPIIQKSESPTASAGKERHHQKIGSTVTRHSSIHKLTRKSPGRRVLAEPVDLGKHLLTLCICIYVTFALQKSTACSCTCPAACSTKSAQFGQLLQKIFRSPRWPAIL